MNTSTSVPPLLVVAGLTGVGKTELLGHLRDFGQQTLDLEALAGHRGSAFGGLDRPPQPASGRFQALVSATLNTVDATRPLWVEDEGPFIGAVGLPVGLLWRIQRAPVVELHRDHGARVERILCEYGEQPPERLMAAIGRMARRLGPERTTRALAAIEAGDLRDAIEVVLPYFDHAYRHRVSTYSRPRLATIEWDYAGLVCLDPADDQLLLAVSSAVGIPEADLPAICQQLRLTAPHAAPCSHEATRLLSRAEVLEQVEE